MINDLISRQAAIEKIDLLFREPYTGDFVATHYNHGVGDALAVVKNVPSAQPEIVRCKDCKHYNAGFECLIEGYGIERDKDWFCADAERRTENDEI